MAALSATASAKATVRYMMLLGSGRRRGAAAPFRGASTGGPSVLSELPLRGDARIPLRGSRDSGRRRSIDLRPSVLRPLAPAGAVVGQAVVPLRQIDKSWTGERHVVVRGV